MSARMSSRLITTTFGRPDEGGLVVVVGAVPWTST
jgi:hypothetical protein